jgi:hypothetical protein
VCVFRPRDVAGENVSLSPGSFCARLVVNWAFDRSFPGEENLRGDADATSSKHGWHVLVVKKSPWRFFTAKNLQRVFTATVLLALLTIVGLFVLNYLALQRPLSKVVLQDARNQGVRATAYYDSYYQLSTVVFDVRGIGQPAGAAGVIRAFVAFAHELQGRDIDEVIISYRGNRKLKMDGSDFLSLGALIGNTTPKQLLWELSHDLRYMNGKQVIANLPGNYAALLQKSLGNSPNEAAASQLLGAITR